MQISRHWRLNAQRYRLQGVRYENGEVSLQSRPLPASGRDQHGDVRATGQAVKVSLKAAG